MAKGAPAAQRQALVRVSGIERFWASKSGGEYSSDTTKVWDGGLLTPEVLAGPADISNITVSRPYRPNNDQAIRRSLAKKVGRWRTTVSVQETDANLTPIGRPITYANALLVRCTAPDADASSGDTAVWELEFAVNGEA